LLQVFEISNSRSTLIFAVVDRCYLYFSSCDSMTHPARQGIQNCGRTENLHQIPKLFVFLMKQPVTSPKN